MMLRDSNTRTLKQFIVKSFYRGQSRSQIERDFRMSPKYVIYIDTNIL